MNPLAHVFKPLGLSLLQPTPLVRLGLGCLWLAAILLGTTPVSADIGPKPDMDFTFSFPQEKIPILQGKLMQCADPNCATTIEFKGLFACTADRCHASTLIIPGGFFEAKYYKISIAFADRLRESNVFTKQQMRAQYQVGVEAERLLVTEKFSFSSFTDEYFLQPGGNLSFLGALLLTLVIETSVATIFVRIIQTKKTFLLWVVLVNLISLPLVWYLLTRVISNPLTSILVAETFAITFEACLLQLVGRKSGLRWKQVLVLSVFMNLDSFLVGLLIQSLGA